MDFSILSRSEQSTGVLPRVETTLAEDEPKLPRCISWKDGRDSGADGIAWIGYGTAPDCDLTQ